MDKNEVVIINEFRKAKEYFSFLFKESIGSNELKPLKLNNGIIKIIVVK
jgi:hypothetical protein